jgi:hypothetical protein
VRNKPAASKPNAKGKRYVAIFYSYSTFHLIVFTGEMQTLAMFTSHSNFFLFKLFKYIHLFILSFRTEKILQDSGVTIAPPARFVGKGGVAISSDSASAAGTLSKPLTHKRVAEVVEDKDEGEGGGDDGDGDDENQKAGEKEEEEEEEEDGDKDGDEDEGGKGSDVEEEDQGMEIIVENNTGESNLNFIILIHSNNS